MSDHGTAERIGEALGHIALKGFLVWACWEIPHPYFLPVTIALLLVDGIDDQIRLLRKGK